MKKFLFLFFSVLLICQSASAQLVVDDFNTGEFTLSGPAGYRNNILAPGAIAGYRNAISLDKNATATVPTVMSLASANGYLNVNVGDGLDYAYSSWGNTTFDPPSPVSLNINASAYTAVVVKLLAAPAGGRVEVILYTDNNGSFDSYNYSLPLNGAGDYILPLNGFQPINLASPAFDVTNIDGIELYFNNNVTPFTNIRADFIQFAAAPTPPVATGLATPSTITAGSPTLFTVEVTPGANPVSSGIGVTADLSSVGGSAAQAFYDNGTNGDVTAGDNIFSYEYIVPAATAANAYLLPVNVTDAEGRSASTDISLTVEAIVAASTTTTLFSNPNPSCVNEAVVLTATVTSAGVPVTVGVVTFLANGLPICSNVPLNPSGQATCNIPASSLTAGVYSLQASYDGDINFANSAASVSHVVNAISTWYPDSDGDGFGSGTGAITSCSRPDRFVDNSSDCNDNNAAINSNAEEICDNGIDDDCDGQTDEGCVVEVDGECIMPFTYSTQNITATSATLTWESAGNPQSWEVKYKKNGPGSTPWTEVILSGDKRMLTISPLDPGSNYTWQIRVSCDGKFINNSGAIRFSTLSATRGMRLGETSNTGLSPQILMVSPNPARSQFMLQLKMDPAVNTTATIRMVDASGQLVQAENAAVANGYLQKMISMKATSRPGLYMVNTLINGKMYTSKVMLEK